MQMKKLQVALLGVERAIEIVPFLCINPVCVVVSMGIAGNCFIESTFPPCITSILTESLGWLFRVTERKKELLSYKCASTYLRKFATVMGAFSGYSSTEILPRDVFIMKFCFCWAYRHVMIGKMKMIASIKRFIHLK